MEVTMLWRTKEDTKSQAARGIDQCLHKTKGKWEKKKTLIAISPVEIEVNEAYMLELGQTETVNPVAFEHGSGWCTVAP